MSDQPTTQPAADALTSRRRFLDTLDFRPVARPWVRWGAFLWDETVERWKQEGWDGTPLDDLFDLDRLLRVDPWYGPVPEFEYQVVTEDDETVTYVNHEGIVMREFKQHHDTQHAAVRQVPGGERGGVRGVRGGATGAQCRPAARSGVARAWSLPVGCRRQSAGVS